MTMSSLSPKLLLHALFITLLVTVHLDHSHATKIVRQIRFYVQDKVAGDNATVWKVAECELSNVLPSKFGSVLVTDTPITVSSERDSEYLGRIQGLIAYTDMNKVSITVLVNVIFTEGEYKGSSLSLVGRNALKDEVREVSVVAGTGAFRLARGYVIMKSSGESADGTRAVYQYDATLFLPQNALDI